MQVSMNYSLIGREMITYGLAREKHLVIIGCPMRSLNTFSKIKASAIKHYLRNSDFEVCLLVNLYQNETSLMQRMTLIHRGTKDSILSLYLIYLTVIPDTEKESSMKK